MNTILVPLDGSALGEFALPFAHSIASALHATLHLAHVHTPMVAVHVGGLNIGDVPIIDEMMDSESRAQELAYLEAICESLASGGLKVTAAILNGMVADALTRYIAETATDLIVIVTHGRGHLTRLLLGSITDTLIRGSHTPILVIKASVHTSPRERGQPFHHIMIPLDGSALAEQAIHPAIELGQAMGSSYTLIQVIEPAPLLGGDPLLDTAPLLTRDETMQRWDIADRYLIAQARRLRGDGLQVYTRAVIAQHPAATILEHAKRSGADLIAMNTHGHSGITRLLFGSVADAVVRNAAIPVLVTRP